uniref:Uncharacterized protein n=1 Tax=Cannabis sativa TaxID=3483 RepID=A0A803QBX7_CANSA
MTTILKSYGRLYVHTRSYGAKSSKKGPKKLASLEEVMKGPVIYKKFTCRSNRWEANELYSTLTYAHQLQKVVTVVGIKPLGSGVYHHLPRDEETPNHNYNGFGAWNQTHLMSEAMLPLQDYFIELFISFA